jgi:hypothetical protein
VNVGDGLLKWTFPANTPAAAMLENVTATNNEATRTRVDLMPVLQVWKHQCFAWVPGLPPGRPDQFPLLLMSSGDLEQPLLSNDGRHVEQGRQAAGGVYQKIRRDTPRTDTSNSPVHCTIKMPRCQLSEGS